MTRIDCRGRVVDGQLGNVSAGDPVEITGDLITVRDATAQKLAALAQAGEPLPINLRGQLLYAVGPSPPKPGQVVGSAGPATHRPASRVPSSPVVPPPPR